MADIKISQLGAAIAVSGSDLLPIVSNGSTLKAPASLVKEYAVGNTDLSGIGDGTPTGAISALNVAKQPKTLDTPLTIGDVQKTTVEAALGGLNSESQSLRQALTTTQSDIAPIEDGTNYSTSYTKGARFIRGRLLYKVTASSVNSSTAINIGTGGNAEVAENVTTQIANTVYKGGVGNNIICRDTKGNYLSVAGDHASTSESSVFGFQLSVDGDVDVLGIVGIREIRYVWSDTLGARLKVTLRSGAVFYINMSST